MQICMYIYENLFGRDLRESCIDAYVRFPRISPEKLSVTPPYKYIYTLYVHTYIRTKCKELFE